MGMEEKLQFIQSNATLEPKYTHEIEALFKDIVAWSYKGLEVIPSHIANHITALDMSMPHELTPHGYCESTSRQNYVR